MANDFEQGRETNSASVEQTDGEYVVFDLPTYVGALWHAKFRILGTAVLGFAIAAGLSYTRPKRFQAQLRFLPPQRSAGISVLSLKSSAGDEYRALLTSDAVNTDVVQHLNLIHYFKVKTPEQALGMLKGSAKFNVDANNFIAVTVTTLDATESAAIANEYYAALTRLEDRMTRDEAAHRLNFIAGPLEIERNRLFAAEDALRDAQQKTGLVLPAAQGNLGIQQIATLRGRISDLRTQLAAAETGATEANPRVINLRTQIASLEGQVDQLQRKSGQSDSPAQLPEMALEVQRRQREVQLHENTLEALNRSLQVSQMQDGYTPGFPLIDPATVPKNKYSPSRATWALVGFMLGLILATAHALARSFWLLWGSTVQGQAAKARWRRAFREPVAKAVHAE